MRFMKFDAYDFAIIINYLRLPHSYLSLTMPQGIYEL